MLALFKIYMNTNNQRSWIRQGDERVRVYLLFAVRVDEEACEAR